MNRLNPSQPDDLVSLADAAVERALAARQGATPIDAEQTSQVGGGLMPMLDTAITRPGGPTWPWIGLILPISSMR